MNQFRWARVLCTAALAASLPCLAFAQSSSPAPLSSPPETAPASPSPEPVASPAPAVPASEPSEAPPASPSPSEASTAPATVPPSTPPAPTVLQRARISLPWHMRPAVAATLLRIDGDIAFTAGTPTSGTTAATIVTGGYAVMRNLGVYARWAMVNNSPHTTAGGTALSNPLLLGLFTPEVVPHVRVTFFLGAAIPIGMGGGNMPDAPTRAAVGAGIYTRSAMDNALFAVNYFTPTAGVGLGYMDHGFTALAECTVLELIRVRGEMVDHDETRTNFTSGLHLGYTIEQYVTASVEVHYQRWLSTPASVLANPALRDQATGQLGLRGNIPLSTKILMRPGIAFSIPFNGNLGPNQGWAFQLGGAPFRRQPFRSLFHESELWA